MKLNIYNQKAEHAGEIELSDKVFGVKAKEALIHQAMVAQMANERQVLAHTKDRSEVRGGGKKPWKQKGTGRARAGSSRSPIWIGGGVTFGPTKERNFEKKINKKMKQKAMLAALSDRLANKSLVILDKLEMEEFKTKAFNEMLRKLEEKVYEAGKGLRGGEDKKGEKMKKEKIKRSILVINDKKDEKVKYSARNLAGVEIINLENINILDLLKYKNVILTVEGVKILEERYKK
jgi:large subunit ribosomal protein L4